MPKLDIFDLEKNKVGTVDLNSEIFEFPINETVMHSVVRWQLASRRAGSASTKTRGEVRGGSAKPWKQKNTGRARHGSIRSPIWRKGGVVFGPKPKDWSFSLPKKIRRQALKSALSLKLKNERVFIVDSLDLEKIKTKNVAQFMDKFDIDKGLVIIDQENENFVKSSRNIKDLKVLNNKGINVYDLLKYEYLIFTKESIDKLQGVLVN